MYDVVIIDTGLDGCARNVMRLQRRQMHLDIARAEKPRVGRQVGIQCSSDMITGSKLADLLSFSAYASVSYQRVSLGVMACRNFKREADLQLLGTDNNNEGKRGASQRGSFSGDAGE